MKLVCYDPHARRTDIADAMRTFPDIAFVRPTTLEALAQDLDGAEILVTSNRAYEAEAAAIIRAHGQALRWIQFTTSGLDKAIGLGLPSGVTVTNAAGLRAFSVAEHALFLMLALMRQSRHAEQGQRDQQWVRDAITPQMDNLVEALRNKRIAGAGLDVTLIEPLPADHELYTLSNVVLSPHVAGAGSQGTGAGMGKILSDNLRLWLKGETLQKIVIERTS